MRKFITDILAKTNLGVEQNAYVLGYVGIGTSSASQKLEVSGGDALIRNAFIGLIGPYGTNYASFSHTSRSGAAKYSFLSGNAGDTYVNSSNGFPVYFRHENVDNVLITADGKLGIGTTSPTRPLYVVSTQWDNTSGSGAIFENNNSVGAGITLKPTASAVTNGSNGWAVYAGGPGAAIGDGNLGFWAHGTNEARVAIQRGGNVGIGTTSPTAKLHVTGELKLTDAAAAYTFFDQINGTYYSVWYRNNNITYLYDSYLNSTPFVVNSSGNVGIGTTSPSEKLHVVGKGIFESNVRIYPVSESWAEGLSFIMPTTANWGGLRWQRQRGNNDGNWYIGFTALDSTDDLVFGANNGGSQVNNIIRLTKAGNVGIGTATPYQLFTVNKSNSAGAGGYIRLENTVGGVGANVGIDFATYSPEYYGVSGPTAQIKATDITNYAGRLDINVKETGPSGALQTLASFNYTGNVGIGTTDPVEKLQVTNGNISIRNTSGGTWGSLRFGTTNTSYLTEWAGIDSDWEGVGINVANLRFYTSYGSIGERMRITSQGNVGIGTTSPNAKLEVVGNTYLRGGALYVDTIAGYTSNVINLASGTNLVLPSGNIGIRVTNPTVSLSLGSSAYDNNPLTGLQYAQVTGGGRLDLMVQTWGTGSDYGLTTGLSVVTPGFDTKDVRVGIGTTSPAAKLQVIGSSSNILHLHKSTGGGDGMIIMSTDFGSGNTYAISPFINGISNGGFEIKDITNNVSRIVIAPSTGNVGIGTTNPSYKLDVYGDIRSGGNDPLLILQPNSGTYAFLQKLSSSNGNYLRLYDGTNYSTFWKDNKVGIGTASPAGKLSIEGDGSEYSNIVFKQSAAQEHLIYASLNYQYNLIGSGAPVWIWGQQGGSERMRLDNTGLGIGTTSPGAKLDVRGTSYFRGAYFGVTIAPSATGADMYFYEGNNPVIYIQSADNIIFNNGYNVGIGTTSPSYKLNVVATSATDADIFQAGMTGVSNGFSVQRVSSAFKYTFVDGNVGIGTTSPVSKFDINGGSLGFSQYNYTPSQGIYCYNGNSEYIEFGSIRTSAGSDWTSSGFRIQEKIDSTWMGFIQFNGDGNNGGVSFGTGLSSVSRQSIPTRMTIASDGNVGIGTTSPVFKLDVNGNTRIGGISSSNTARLNVGGVANEWVADFQASSTTNQSYGLVVRAGTSSTDFPFYVLNSSSANAFFAIKGNGNVGIGTTSPLRALHIVGGGGTAQIQSTGTSSHIYFGDTNSSVIDNQGMGSVGDNLWFSAGGFERMRITSGGNVGIGTTSPTAKLDVQGNPGLVTINTNGALSAGGQIISGAGEFASSSSGTDLNFRAGATHLMVLKTSGNVGIGTTSPSAKLQTVSSGLGDGGGIRITNSGAGGDDYRIWPTATVNGEGAGKLIFTNNGGNVLTLTSDGNVGIGTTSPGFKLTVAGGSGDWATKFSSGTTSAYFAHSGGYGASINAGSNATSSTYLLELISNGSTRVYVRGDGNVGIGTTTPSASLNIASDGNTQFTITRTNASNSKQFNINVESDSQTSISYDSNSPLVIGTSTNPGIQAGFTERMRITSGGNVGIGTTNPQRKLHVASGGYYLLGGNGNTGYTSDGLWGATATPNKLQTTGYGSTYGTGSMLLGYSDNGSGLYSPAYGFEVKSTDGIPVAGRIVSALVMKDIDTDSNPWVINNNGDTYISNPDPQINLTRTDNASSPSARLNFRTADGTVRWQVATNQAVGTGFEINQGNASTNRLYINTSGNVGIGTTSPGYKLDISGALRATGTVYSDNGSLAGALNLGQVVSIGSSFGSYANLIFTMHNGGGFSDIMKLQGNGNVGIGTTTPGDPLHIVTSGSDKFIRIENTNLYTGLWLNDGGSNSGWLVLSGYTDTASPGDFAIREYGVQTSLTIKQATGNVGIGTTSPAHKLDVSGNISVTTYTGTKVGFNVSDAFSAYSTSVAHYGISYAFTATPLALSGYFGLGLFTDGAERMRIAGNGNVGIGTISPTQKLEVNGNTWVSGTVYINRGINSTEGYTYFDHPGTQVWKQGIFSDNTSTFSIGNGGGFTRLFNITNGGNVGIGTTGPYSKLEITPSSVAWGEGIVINPASGYSAIFYRLEGAQGSNYTGTWAVGKAFSGDGGGELLQVVKNGLTGSAAYRVDASQQWKTNGDSIFGFNVGIGTTSPSSTLDVSSSANATTMTITSDGANEQFRIRRYSDNNKQLIFGYHSSNFGTIQAVEQGVNYRNLILEPYGGNVGIGTTSPAHKLSVSANQTTNDWGMVLQNTNTGGYGVSQFFNLYGYGSSPAADFSALQIRADYPGYGRISFVVKEQAQSTALESLVLRGNGQVYMNAGNVGIGTTSPTHKLTVTGDGSGTMKVGGPGVSGNYTGISLNGTLDVSNYNILSSPTDNHLYINRPTGNDIYFRVNNNDQVIINSSGNVGIGTSSPSYKLDVTGLSGDWATRFASNAGASAYFAHGGGYGAYIDAGSNATSATYLMSLVSNGSTRVYVRGDGVVGIGTGSPSLESAGLGLDIFGDSYTQLRVRSGSTSAGIEFKPGSGKRWEIQANTSSKWFVYDRTDQLYRLLIDTDGNVGIGTTSPNTKFNIQETNSGTEGLIITNWNSVNTLLLGSDSSTGGGKITLRTNGGTSNVFISSYGISHFNGGNVGIGTTSPSEKLEVNGSIRLSDGNADGPQLKLASSGYSDWNIDNYNGSLRAYYGSTEYTRLTSSGYFGIGTSSPSYKLHVEGNVSGISIYASHDIAAFSDITVKKDVERIENAIEKVKELNGYTYVRTDDETGTRRAGVIAQEVQKVLPEVVSQNPDGTLNVAYSNMIALLIEGMKEQQATIERMQQEINELKK